MLQRQREGIAVAQAAGKYKGRVRKPKPENWEQLRADYQVRKLGITDLAKASGVSRHTIYSWLKENNS